MGQGGRQGGGQGLGHARLQDQPAPPGPVGQARPHVPTGQPRGDKNPFALFGHLEIGLLGQGFGQLGAAFFIQGALETEKGPDRVVKAPKRRGELGPKIRRGRLGPAQDHGPAAGKKAAHGEGAPKRRAKLLVAPEHLPGKRLAAGGQQPLHPLPHDLRVRAGEKGKSGSLHEATLAEAGPGGNGDSGIRAEGHWADDNSTTISKRY